MRIKYTYEVISVDAPSRCMEVVYSAEGHNTMHISARLPFDGEDFEAVIRAFAPVPIWVELARPVVAPPVGLTGEVDENVITAEAGYQIPITEV